MNRRVQRTCSTAWDATMEPIPTRMAPGRFPRWASLGRSSNDTNTAASFSSTGQGIGLVPYSPALNPAKFTVEAWVNTPVTNGQAPVSSSYGNAAVGWWMQSDNGWWDGGTRRDFGNDNHVNTAALIIPGQWSYIVINYDASQQSGRHLLSLYSVRQWADGRVHLDRSCGKPRRTVHHRRSRSKCLDPRGRVLRRTGG